MSGSRTLVVGVGLPRRIVRARARPRPTRLNRCGKPTSATGRQGTVMRNIGERVSDCADAGQGVLANRLQCPQILSVLTVQPGIRDDAIHMRRVKLRRLGTALASQTLLRGVASRALHQSRCLKSSEGVLVDFRFTVHMLSHTLWRG